MDWIWVESRADTASSLRRLLPPLLVDLVPVFHDPIDLVLVTTVLAVVASHLQVSISNRRLVCADWVDTTLFPESALPAARITLEDGFA